MLRRVMPKRTEAVRRAQQRYEADKVAAGEHVQINLKFKTPDDVKMFAKLRGRFPDLTPAGIVRMAVKELAKKGNR